MQELPLFPLQTVLFPGAPLELYIFEERYQLMIRHCLEEHEPFGVVLMEPGAEEDETPDAIYTIGCMAQIVEVEPLGDGRMNIVVVGTERFRVTALSYEQPYLVGWVELYPFENPAPSALATAANRLQPWLVRYLKALTATRQSTVELSQWPEEPATVVLLAAYLLQIPPEQKQDLLSLPNLLILAQKTALLYRREVRLLEAQQERRAPHLRGPFSAN